MDVRAKQRLFMWAKLKVSLPTSSQPLCRFAKPRNVTMEISQPVIAALIALAGVILGIFINEFFRRKNRVELFSKEVFQKRLSVYEELYEKMNKSSSISTEVIENSIYTKDERHEIWSAVVMEVAEFTDSNELYLNENIVVHCLASLMGVEDIYYIENPEEKKERLENLGESLVNAKKMIKAETGLEVLDKLFGSISKAKHESDIIAYFQERKKELKK